MAKDPNKPVVLARAAYLGGLPDDPGSERLKLPLLVSPMVIGMNTGKKHPRLKEWSDVESVSFDAGTTAKSRAGKALALGVLALASKKTQDEAHMSVFLRDGNAMIFHVVGMSAEELRAKVQPYLAASSTPCLDDASDSSSSERPEIPADGRSPVPLSVGDEISKLVALRDSGAITDDEFLAHKARLLD